LVALGGTEVGRLDFEGAWELFSFIIVLSTQFWYKIVFNTWFWFRIMLIIAELRTKSSNVLKIFPRNSTFFISHTKTNNFLSAKKLHILKMHPTENSNFY